MNIWVKRQLQALAIVAVAAATAAASAKGLDDFKLTRAIPADAFLAVHTRGHDGQVFLNTQMARLWDELEKARLDRDIKRLFKTMHDQNAAPIPEGEEDPFEAKWQQVSDLATSVDWSSLAEREYAMGMKLSFPSLEFVVMMRPPTDKVESNFAGLSGIAKHLVSMDEANFELSTEGEGSHTIHRVSATHVPLPVVFTLARLDDTIVLGFGTTMVEQAMALLNGEEGETLASTDRFQAAFKKLPAPTDGAMYFDAARFFASIRKMAESVMDMDPTPPPAEDDPMYAQYTKMRALPGKIIDALDIFDYMASTATTDGMQTVSDEIVALRDDASSKPLYRILFSNGALDAPLKFIPVDAGDAAAGAGIDLRNVFDEIVKFINEEVPDGEQMTAMLESSKEMIGFDIREEILGWLKGEYVTFSLPGPTAYSPGEFVVMISVRDAEKGAALVNFGFSKLEGNEQFMVEDATISGAEGFKSIKSPMFGMVGMKAPTIGFHAGWMIIGSSPEIIEKALAVAAGDEDNFAMNDRFKKEGIPVGDNVVATSFKDMTKFGEQIGQMLNMMGMLQMMMPPEVSKDPAVGTLLRMAPKLGRVVRKLDFLLSSASQTTMKGNVMYSKTVMNYREPPEVTKPAPPAD